MPKRTDIKSILVIGSGPIVIGQACEFDYSGTQAIKALKEEGYKVILVNSNPATIMTDPEFADRTYIEPLTADFVTQIIEKERPDAVLPTMGGQTALNLALELDELGVFKKYGCKLIGANVEAIKTAEDRALFKQAMDEIGIESAKSKLITTLEQAKEYVKEIGYPNVLRPSRTLGGTGGGIVYGPNELEEKVNIALHASPNHEVLMEESLLGWKEIELEVMRDLKDNVVIICGIENFDPMGVHTGDSITVAPILTLTDKEYQILRDDAIKVIRRIGVDTGGSNVQFAINPTNGRVIIIEMNPRVSRSSALASKATGFPIAKIAAKLAVGYTLDEIKNDITKETPACFEPSIDYVVVKIPRFNFEKFQLADAILGTQMKSVGEVLSFGRNFSEAMQKAICSMEMDSYGFDRSKLVAGLSLDQILEKAKKPAPDRLWYIAEGFRLGASIEQLYAATKVDRWFLAEIESIIQREIALSKQKITELNLDSIKELKHQGFSDRRIAALTNTQELEVRNLRKKLGVTPVYKTVDTCAAEFKAETPYLYSTYDLQDESPASKNKKIIILGSGPNRIGQGIEFDYCCVHAVFGLQKDGYEAIMLNCNPETVSTDYDISDRLYFEPLSFESVLNVIEREKPDGVIVQFGGQTPLKLCGALEKAGVPIIGTSVDSIDIAEDRERFAKLIEELELKQPENGRARSAEEAKVIAHSIGYPVMSRPSFVLGGRAMRVLHDDKELEQYFQDSVQVSHDRPVLIDRYLHNAIEVDVDAVSDGKEVFIAGVMEHIERAGIHSGDSTCSLPPQSLAPNIILELERQAVLLAKSLNVIGLMNVQFAVTKQNEIFILEVNPRASRTVPFVAKATGIPWVQIAARVMAGKTFKELNLNKPKQPKYYSVKAPIFPFKKFAGVDTILGPEMKSTGESMGLYPSFSGSFAKAQIAVGSKFPTEGKVFISVMNDDKEELPVVAKNLLELGFSLVATKGTAEYLKERGFPVETVNKVREGQPHVIDLLNAGQISWMINTPEGSSPLLDSRSIRLAANELGLLTYTTMAGARAAIEAIRIIKEEKKLEVKALQDYFN